jgi:hypothetical protein
MAVYIFCDLLLLLLSKNPVNMEVNNNIIHLGLDIDDPFENRYSGT